MLAVLNVPASHRKRLRKTNHVERTNQERKRRGRTVHIWPNPAGRDRLYEAQLMEQHERGVGTTWLKSEGHESSVAGGLLQSGSALPSLTPCTHYNLPAIEDLQKHLDTTSRNRRMGRYKDVEPIRKNQVLLLNSIQTQVPTVGSSRRKDTWRHQLQRDREKERPAWGEHKTV